MSLYVVRHAHAGQRASWNPADGERELSEKGRAQAVHVADVLHGTGAKVLLTSPKIRCRQTLEPLADAVGIEIVTERRLDEGTGDKKVLALVDELAGTDAVLCTHGDIIPVLLRSLRHHGVDLDDDLRWQKGSIWTIERDTDGTPRRARYLPPGP